MVQAEVMSKGVQSAAMKSGTLFEGQKIWFSDYVPQRQWFKEIVEANAGTVVKIEKQADIRLVDHKRKSLPPGAYSYRYVELSYRNGRLENLQDHLAGPPVGTVRPVGSVTIASRGKRVPFTAEDDQFLYNWVQPHRGQKGELGNELYKALELANPRHTFQSWRDRWVKYVSKERRGLTQVRGADASDEIRQSPPRRPEAVLPNSKRVREPLDGKDDFTVDDSKMLMKNADSILAIDPDLEDEAWTAWTNAHPHHSAQDWKHFWETKILPIVRAKIKAGKERSFNEPKTQHLQLNTKVGRQHSPSFKPESPTIPDSKVSETMVAVPIAGPDPPRSPKRKRHDVEDHVSSSLPELSGSGKQSPKRTRITYPELPLEIQSTPERDATPTSYDVRPVELGLDDEPESPLFMPQEEEDAAFSTALPPPESSPLGLNFFGDSVSQAGNEPTPSSSKSPTLREISHESTEDAFETAAEEIFDTAPPIQEIDTQRLFDRGQTQVPDFYLPEPPSSPSLVDEGPSNGNSNRLDEWVERMSHEGVDEALILDAHYRTSGNTDLVRVVLESRMAGKGVPDKVRGVWTDEDDEALEGSHGRDIERLQEKHGAEAFNQRFEFLEVWRNAEDEG